MHSWQDWVGKTQSAQDLLTPALLQRFLATIDSSDDIRSAAGQSAPQAIHWCLCSPDARTDELGADGHPRRSEQSFLPPIPMPRRMWASSKLQFLSPMAVGAAIERTSTIVSIVEKKGGSGHLVFVDVDHAVQANGLLCVTERQTLVYREASAAPPVPRPVDIADATKDWPFHRSLIPSEPLLFRYSALTFNSHRIHYDAPYAVEEEGYRGLVVHGPLTATLLLDLAAREFGANALASFAFRGQSPAIAGEPLHLVGRKDGTQLVLSALGGDGRVVMAAEAVLRD